MIRIDIYYQSLIVWQAFWMHKLLSSLLKIDQHEVSLHHSRWLCLRQRLALGQTKSCWRVSVTLIHYDFKSPR